MIENGIISWQKIKLYLNYNNLNQIKFLLNSYTITNVINVTQMNLYQFSLSDNKCDYYSVKSYKYNLQLYCI